MRIQLAQLAEGSGATPFVAVVECAGCYASPPFFTELLGGLEARYAAMAVQLHNPLQPIAELVRRVIWQLGLEAQMTIKVEVPAVSTNGAGTH